MALSSGVLLAHSETSLGADGIICQLVAGNQARNRHEFQAYCSLVRNLRVMVTINREFCWILVCCLSHLSDKMRLL